MLNEVKHVPNKELDDRRGTKLQRRGKITAEDLSQTTQNIN